MANLEGMPIGSLPEATSIQDEDEIVVYRPSTGKAYQANTDLIDSLTDGVTTSISAPSEFPDGVSYSSTWNVRFIRHGNMVFVRCNCNLSAEKSSDFKTLFTVPEELRPKSLGVFQSYCTQFGVPMLINLTTGGNFQILCPSQECTQWGLRECFAYSVS